MNSLRRIGWLLALVFVLPALSYSVYEMSSLSRDEVMIENVYSRQLEAILFSVNQYTNDMVNGWISKTERALGENNEQQRRKQVYELQAFNSAVQCVFTCDTISKSPVIRTYGGEDSVKLKTEIKVALGGGMEKIRQLVSYKMNGFQKVDLLEFPGTLQCLFYVSQDLDHSYSLTGFLIDPDEFIQTVVGPRLQIIAGDQFILSVLRADQSSLTYTTQPGDSISTAEAVTKDLWLFPDYKLGIATKGSSLQDLAEKRRNTNLILLGGLDVVLILAVIMVFRNVKKEVQLAQNKADFISNVSHEIRTPLALISMFAETLEMGRVQSDEKRNEYYGIISKETHRLSGIVNRILNFSQAEANKKTVKLVSLSVNESVREVLKTYDYFINSKGFQCHFKEKEEVWVMADREAVSEVIMNLIDNAVKYSGDKKNIGIEVYRENELGCVAISDEGIGISIKDQKHIFDKFYRVSAGNLAGTRGTGLGLSLVKQLMDVQHGSVQVASTPGKGSTFTLRFPLKKNIE